MDVNELKEAFDDYLDGNDAQGLFNFDINPEEAMEVVQSQDILDVCSEVTVEDVLEMAGDVQDLQ